MVVVQASPADVSVPHCYDIVACSASAPSINQCRDTRTIQFLPCTSNTPCFDKHQLRMTALIDQKSILSQYQHDVTISISGLFGA